MFTETRISLVVGLAFIVCFGIVLVNRGRPLGPSVADVARESGTANRHTATGPLRLQHRVRESLSTTLSTNNTKRITAANHPAFDSRSPVAAPFRPARRGSRIGKQAGSSTVPPPGSAFVRSDPEPDTGTAPGMSDWSASPASVFDIRITNARELQPDSSVQASTKRSAGANSEPKATSSIPALLTKPVPQQPKLIESTHPKRARSSNSRKSRHTVRKGETLWSIASSRYGRATASLLNAVFEANRSILDSPDQLMEGDVLELPELNGQAPSAESSEGNGDATKPKRSPRRKSDKRDASEARGWRWYQVADGDRYSTIAAHELGNSSHWPQLYELNTDIFPNPDQIRGGVRIRIPTAGANRMNGDAT